MQISPRQIKSLIADQSVAATELRAARSNYRDALISGDLPAAIRARRKMAEAEIVLDAVRFIVEGDVDG